MTPYVAIILFGVIAVLLIIPGKITLLADLYAFGSMISFTAAHLSVIVLRYREPDLERPFRAPLNIRCAGCQSRRPPCRGPRHVGRVARHRLVPAAEPARGLRLDGGRVVGYVIFRKAKGTR